MVTVVIVSFNTREILSNCLDALFRSGMGKEMEVFVVDNDSRDRSAEMVAERFPEARLIANKQNLGFAAANNQALRIAGGTYLVLLNSDTVLRPGSAAQLVTFLEQTPHVAMAGPRMRGADGRVQNSFDNFPCLATELLNKSLLRLLFPRRYAGRAGQSSEPCEVDSLIGACLAVRAAAIAQVGLLDEDYFFFLEETDWCLRMRRAGWRIVHLPGVEIVHLQGQSKRQRPALAWVEYYRSMYTFFRKHRSPAAYRALRVFRFVKLLVNLLLTVAALLLTLGQRGRFREKTAVYARLVWWHLCQCPDSVGLR